MIRNRALRFTLAAPLLAAALAGGAASSLLGTCGPFNDVTDVAFCPFVLEIFTLGVTTGTTPSTYDPASHVSRLQMAAFLSRSVDSVLRRGSRRAPLGQFWPGSSVRKATSVGTNPSGIASDGEDVWAVNSSKVSRIHGSDGRVLETWTGATAGRGVAVAFWYVFVAGTGAPGHLYQIDPSQTAGAVTTVATNLGDAPWGIAFDGSRLWTANRDGDSVSIVTPGSSIPWTVTTVGIGASSQPQGIVFDGSSIWVGRSLPPSLAKLDSNGAILLTVTVGAGPEAPVYDGTNVWMPSDIGSVTVVRASNGAILATLTGNGLSSPIAAAFDGQRVLVANAFSPTVSIWKAADLTPLGSFSAGVFSAGGVCSNGIDFFLTDDNVPGHVVKF